MSSLVTKPEVFGGFPSNAQKAQIVTVDPDSGKPLSQTDPRFVHMEFQFNPNQLTVSKGVNWTGPKNPPPALNAPKMTFSGGTPAGYSLKDVMFDTSQIDPGPDRDVRTYTQELLRLVIVYGDINDRDPPPPVQFQWGKFILFRAVVTKVDVTYTMFDADGIPVRAKCTITLTQQDPSDDFAGSMNPTTRTEARKTHIVQQGDRLDLIAHREYGSAGYWRHLAEANGLADPRALQPGQILALPPLP
jgi:hypothetical protein